jgi:hypothetical protein
MRTARLLIVALLCLAALSALADTGTYEILNYQVTLTPHSDGKVDIDCYQKWRVTGGSIPWITVGLPNSNFAITTSGLAVSSIHPQNEGGWSGVRIELDRDYRPGDQFEISFSVSQSKLFYADATNYRLDYWPGWYDRAAIQALTIRLKSFAKTESITSDPAPTSRSETELVWSGMNLDPGERFAIHVSFPKATLPQAIPEQALHSEGERPEAGGSGYDAGSIAIAIFLILAFIGLIYLRVTAGGYSGGGIWYGGGGGEGRGGGGRRTGGGGGFGGGGFSCVCACACVGCACACACAGGGGAGCARKHERHRCPQCDSFVRSAT